MTKRRAIILGVVLLAASAGGVTLSNEQLDTVGAIIDAIIGAMQ